MATTPILDWPYQKLPIEQLVIGVDFSGDVSGTFTSVSASVGGSPLTSSEVNGVISALVTGGTPNEKLVVLLQGTTNSTPPEVVACYVLISVVEPPD